MKIRTVLPLAAVAVLGAGAAQAVPFTPTFSDYAFPGSQFTVDAAANAFFSANYGITIDNSYLYRDSRDTFDGIGVANGEVSEIGTFQIGRINFLDTTNFVTVDFLAILDTTYSAFTAGGTLLQTFSAPGGATNGTFTLGGGIISYLTFATTGGFGTVSGLTYDYDGTTDGHNDDINPPTSVPEPTTLALLGFGLAAFGFRTRRKTA
jgi:hypothetical protein